MNKKITTLFASFLLAMGVSAQTQRTSVLEEFSTAYCQYCPEGYKIIKKAIDSHPGTLWLVHHAGFMTDAITIPASERLTFLYGTNAFAPAYMIDRTVPSETYTAYSPVWAVDDSARIASQLDEMAAVPCFTSVAIGDLHYDAATRNVTATISGRMTQPFDTNITRLTVYLVEDSIVLAQASTTGTIDDYVHMHAVRDCVTDIFGEPLSFLPDGTFRYEVNYTVPAKAVASHCRLVALVHYFKATNLTLNAVLNATATDTYLTTHTAGIDNSPNLAAFTVYPNPASDYVMIHAAQTIRRIVVSDMVGRQVAAYPVPDNSNEYLLDTRSFAPGLYLVTVSGDKGTSTQKVVISR